MADDTEDEVLELDTELELEEDEDGDEEDHDEGEAGDETEEVYDFGEEGAAPAQESSVIRDLRKANRELAKKVSQLQRGEQAQTVEVGPKPTLEACGYDEDVYDAELLAWTDRVALAKRAEQEQQQREEAKAREWAERKEAYEADKRNIRDPKFAEAEDEVFSALSDQHQALIMLTAKPAALIAALARNPEQLETLSKLDLARAAMTIGKLEDKLQMRTRQSANPERRVTGNAGFAGGSDKRLAKLKAKAEQTGDYSEYFAAKRAAAQA